MIHVWLKNGNFEILRNVHELKNLIEAELGKDVASEVEKLIGAVDYTEQKIDTDLTAYELQLESFNSMCLEVLASIKMLTEEIEGQRRLNRSEILKQINNLKRLVENEI